MEIVAHMGMAPLLARLQMHKLSLLPEEAGVLLPCHWTSIHAETGSDLSSFCKGHASNKNVTEVATIEQQSIITTEPHYPPPPF